MRLFAVISLFFYVSNAGISQELLRFPSFEMDTLSKYWKGCNFNTSPDHQPYQMGVNTIAKNGNKYISLVARDNNTFEDIGQRLIEPIIVGQSYSLQLDLAYSEDYISSFKNPIKLKVWLGRDSCEKGELIWKSPAITHEEWETYQFLFSPGSGDKMQFIYLEAAYISTNRYDGNILIDNLSLLKQEDAEQCIFRFPNAFTPDNDDLNDGFGAIGDCQLIEYNLAIFNRWGKVVFETNDYRKKWDGIFENNPAPSEMYFWTATFTRFQNTIPKKEVKRGTITLLR